MTDPGHSVRLRISGRTDTGQVRDNNEDSIHVWSRDDWLVLAVVADGMGGAVAGEEASRIAIETVRSGLGDALGKHLISTDGFNPDSLSPHLKESIQDANLNIVERARRNPELKGMGTTITLALIREMNLIIGHVGDSRAYLIHDDGDINQITADHSFVQALVAAGHITEDEAEEHPMRNVLYRALGQASDVEVDIYSQHLSPNDRLVLCSDGLTLHLKAREIAEVVLRLDDPEDASNELVEMANARGGRDNISVIVVKVEEDNRAGDHHMNQSNDMSGYENVTEPPGLRENTGMGAADTPGLTDIRRTDTQARLVIIDDCRQSAAPETNASQPWAHAKESKPTVEAQRSEGPDHLHPDRT